MPEPVSFIAECETACNFDIATEEELLDFANRLRNAGHADPIEALMPSKPGSSSSCLIANAVNFNSEVLPSSEFDRDEKGQWKWYMQFPQNASQETVDAVARICNTKPRSYRNRLVVDLPQHIGNAADAFDNSAGWTAQYVDPGAF